MSILISQRQTLAALQIALSNSEIKIKRSATYQHKHAKNGHIFYRIKYVTNHSVVYDGAYEMNKKWEAAFLKANRINEFLLAQLAKVLKVTDL